MLRLIELVQDALKGTNLTAKICYKSRYKIVIIGLYPEKNITKSVKDKLNLLAKQASNIVVDYRAQSRRNVRNPFLIITKNSVEERERLSL